MKKVIILGITGVLGKEVVNLITKYGDYKIIGASYLKNSKQFKKIIANLKDLKAYSCDYNFKINSNLAHYNNQEDLVNKIQNYDILINCSSGIDSLKAVDITLKQNKYVYSANKQILLLAGNYFWNRYKNFNEKFISLDSELSAIKTLLRGNYIKDIKNVYITMTGGVLCKTHPDKYHDIKNKDLLNYHPVWKMGSNNTFDSNTLINKLFEILEVYHCFNIDFKKINVLLHPDCHVHAIIEWNDATMNYLVNKPSMAISIQKMLYPKILNHQNNKLFYKKVPDISFLEMNSYQKEIINFKKYFIKNINLGILLFAINEIYFALFKENKIKITDLINFFQTNLNKYKGHISKQYCNLDEIIKCYQKIYNILKNKYINI